MSHFPIAEEPANSATESGRKSLDRLVAVIADRNLIAVLLVAVIADRNLIAVLIVGIVVCLIALSVNLPALDIKPTIEPFGPYHGYRYGASFDCSVPAF